MIMSAATLPTTMTTPLKLDDASAQRLCCPVCKGPLHQEADHFHCESSACGPSFPIINGTPILINEANSIFSIADYSQQAKTYFTPKKASEQSPSLLKRCRKSLTRWLIPPIDHNIKSERNFAKLAKLLQADTPVPRVLVVGGSVLGQGLAALQKSGAVQFIETDVSLSDSVKLISDAHDLPFAENTFDGVIVQAVLEHVVDPYRCVAEIHRVLKPNGIVYAETPFMQQVHGAAYDFTRFSHLGHRRLFRHYAEIESGAACGPGMALAWSYKYFLTSFLTRNTPNFVRTIINTFANVSSFWLKYFDYYLIDKPGSLDAASGYYFFGRKSSETISDKEIIKLYRGCI